jgi:hypothetical protein
MAIFGMCGGELVNFLPLEGRRGRDKIRSAGKHDAAIPFHRSSSMCSIAAWSTRHGRGVDF